MPLIKTTEMKAFLMREEGKTLEEIGNALGVSRERARQLLMTYALKKRQGIICELRTRSITVLQNLQIKTLGELRERYKTFKNPDGCVLKYKYRGCGHLVYKDVGEFLARHADKPDSYAFYNRNSNSN